MGTLVYIVKHDTISSILDASEHVTKLDLETQYKKSLGDQFETCKGELNLYQLDGPEGLRFVISLHWDKKTSKKLQKYLGIKISCIRKHDLLDILSLIEETRRLRNASLYDLTNYDFNTISTQRRNNGTIHEEPSETALEQNNVCEISIVKPSANETKLEVHKNENEISNDDNDTDASLQSSAEFPNRSEDSQTSSSSRKSDGDFLTNGSKLEVEIHTEVEPDTRVRTSSRAMTIDEDLRGYEESGVPLSRRQSSTSYYKPIEDNSSSISVDLSRNSTPKAVRRPSLHRSISESDASVFTMPRPSHAVHNGASVIDNSEGKDPSFLGRLFTKIKSGRSSRRNFGKSKSAKDSGQDMSRLALYETSSLRSTNSIATLTIGSLATGSTVTLNTANRKYNRKFFRGKPASMHVLTRERKLIPIYDAMNCLLEFHQVMKPVKIIGVKSTNKDDLAEDQIMQIIQFLQKPENLELRTSRPDYVLFNSVVKARNFTRSELKLLLST